MFHSLPARWLAALPALAAFAAGAQTGPAPATAAPPPFRSAMEGYKPYAEEKPIPWKDANETVRQRGGWRGYAKESADDKPLADPHAGHSKPAPKDKP